jgi:hypothetical protein
MGEAAWRVAARRAPDDEDPVTSTSALDEKCVRAPGVNVRHRYCNMRERQYLLLLGAFSIVSVLAQMCIARDLRLSGNFGKNWACSISLQTAVWWC